MTRTLRIKRNLRWLTVVLYATAGVLCADIIREIFWGVIMWLPSGHFLAVGYFLAGVLVWIAVLWLRPKLGHWSQWRNYPPSALPVLLGYLIFASLEASDCSRFLLLCWPLLTLVLAVLLHWYFHATTDTLPLTAPLEPEDADPEPASRIAALSRKDVLEWVKDQSPGRNRDRDFVGLRRTVRKLLAVVTSVRVGAIKPNLMETCVVIGPFGSGKSTLVEHLRCEAEKEPFKKQVIVAVTSCWGFESSEKAQEHILEAGVDRLDDLIDCSAIRRLPRAYAAALRDNKGWAAAAGNVVAGFSDPVVTLKHLSSLLELTDRTLVVVVEDIDRGGTKFDMHQLLAMFYHLRQIPRVSFILTMSAPPSIELGRIAECVHRFKGLRPTAGAAIIQKFSESIRSEKIVYPASLAPVRSAEGERAMFPRGPDWRLSAARLAATLRTLKVCLHAVHEEWPALDGEVDLDEFISFVTLREAAPAAFAFMTEHAGALRSLGGLPLSTGHKSQDEKAAAVQEKWNALVEDVEFDVRAAGELLAFLFMGTSRVFSVETPSGGSGYQSQWTDGVYLEQMHNGAVESGGRDQPALRFLDGFKQRQKLAEHAGALLNDRTLQRITTLSVQVDCLSPTDRFRILGFLLEKEREKGAHATLHAEFLSRVIDWIPRNGGDLDETQSFLLGEISCCLPRCLTLALELTEVGADNPSIASKFSPIAADLIKQEFRKLDGESLAAASPDEAPSLHTQLFDRLGPLENWLFLADATVEAMATHPEKMLGQMIDTFRMPDGALDQEKIRRFFSERSRDFYQHVARYRPSDGKPGRLQLLRQKAANEGQKILDLDEQK